MSRGREAMTILGSRRPLLKVPPAATTMLRRSPLRLRWTKRFPCLPDRLLPLFRGKSLDSEGGGVLEKGHCCRNYVCQAFEP